MPINRYRNASLINGGLARGSSNAYLIYNGVETGSIRSTTRVTQQGERLDVIAGQSYGDATLWWVIAAASGIGWGLQVPPGTSISIPNIEDVMRVF